MSPYEKVCGGVCTFQNQVCFYQPLFSISSPTDAIIKHFKTHIYSQCSRIYLMRTKCNKLSASLSWNALLMEVRDLNRVGSFIDATGEFLDAPPMTELVADCLRGECTRCERALRLLMSLAPFDVSLSFNYCSCHFPLISCVELPSHRHWLRWTEAHSKCEQSWIDFWEY